MSKSTSSHDSDRVEPTTVILESTFPTGEVARWEYPVEREPIPLDREPEHWLVLAVDGAGRLLLDTDDLRAVWTGPDPLGGDRP